MREHRKLRRIHIVKTLEQLATIDAWPGDEVWMEQALGLGPCRTLGRISGEGKLVTLEN
jgi:hypothetical protein